MPAPSCLTEKERNPPQFFSRSFVLYLLKGILAYADRFFPLIILCMSGGKKNLSEIGGENPGRSFQSGPDACESPLAQSHYKAVKGIG